MDEISKNRDREKLRPGMGLPHGESVERDDDRPLSGSPSSLETAVSSVITQSFPDRRLLVLLALERNGRAHLLDDEERNVLDLARPHLGAALQSSAALNDVLTRIGDEAAEFEREWNAAGADSPPRSTRPAIRRDRPAVPRRAQPAIRQVAYAAAVVAAVTLTVFLVGDRSPSTVVMVGSEEMKEVDQVSISGRTVWEDYEGGMLAEPREEPPTEIYFAGIIDILMTYTIRKKMEHSYKVFRTTGEEEVSSVNPIAYHERFCKFLNEIIK